MRSSRLLAALLLSASASAATAWAKPGFDEKCQQDYNIINPINK